MSKSSGWWVSAACAAGAVHLYGLAAMPNSAGLVWEPVLRDSRCFASLGENPIYLEVVADLERKKAGYRSRLPKVLAKHGSTDYVAKTLEEGAN